MDYVFSNAYQIAVLILSLSFSSVAFAAAVRVLKGGSVTDVVGDVNLEKVVEVAEFAKEILDKNRDNILVAVEFGEKIRELGKDGYSVDDLKVILMESRQRKE